MFYLLAVSSMLGYALQNALLVRYARRMDGLSLAFYRNISFLVTLLPLLFLSSPQEIAEVLSHWKVLLISGIAGGVYLAIVFESYHFIAIGVGHTIKQAAINILMALAGLLLYEEVLPAMEFLLVAVVVLSCIWLSMQRVDAPHISQKLLLGISLSLLSAFPVIITKIILTDMSRAVDPLASGYFWEAAIGIASAVTILLRWVLLRRGLTRIDSRTMLGITAAASPTLIGTGCYALALSMGPIAIVSAIGSGSLIVTALCGWLWYHEKLSRSQWAALVFILVAIAWLKFV
ncbi:hypothetical protein A2454_03440 [Candidatus Peribacteria bacterium RIFOXYC2_FULL_55_14]|nr:MAG: Integral membrane protein [Candidatus Peribacteria bacterium GW2011_GWC2_54_8]OGJ72184.1 MAG: hypothetical protein A2198_02030 [Candidatus Peribacteria bacterium RIFOXYA1_FULL_56_14]OGJ73553.1 MAG: hypothetical protein A2217_03610 [Candidatus Peribacteria bacterium RIFOXYA2_FULL_55_28]OGJ75757.1 MAG: hypothetical protein A2384_02165 [Candidatus Peribacteria bacterium RIFOXYB1_FULL_54_35]OGJ76962.1 MAG: hypothetical protein A2327_01985 [Candidatus Peribacteria bacterium RIFOXYB2_FULL_54_